MTLLTVANKVLFYRTHLLLFHKHFVRLSRTHIQHVSAGTTLQLLFCGAVYHVIKAIYVLCILILSSGSTIWHTPCTHFSVAIEFVITVACVQPDWWIGRLFEQFASFCIIFTVYGFVNSQTTNRGAYFPPSPSHLSLSAASLHLILSAFSNYILTWYGN